MGTDDPLDRLIGGMSKRQDAVERLVAERFAGPRRWWVTPAQKVGPGPSRHQMALEAFARAQEEDPTT